MHKICEFCVTSAVITFTCSWHESLKPLQYSMIIAIVIAYLIEMNDA